jgi:TonB family protein
MKTLIGRFALLKTLILVVSMSFCISVLAQEKDLLEYVTDISELPVKNMDTKKWVVTKIDADNRIFFDGEQVLPVSLSLSIPDYIMTNCMTYFGPEYYLVIDRDKNISNTNIYLGAVIRQNLLAVKYLRRMCAMKQYGVDYSELTDEQKEMVDEWFPDKIYMDIKNAPQTPTLPLDVYYVVDTQAEFPGGNNALIEFFQENLEYPLEAYEQGIQGRAVCLFVVNQDGSISHVQISESAGDDRLDQEAIRVIQSMPKWKPATSGGKKVRVACKIPINFSL